MLFLSSGEIQGTVHRRLLEERVDELKVGAVLLLKQVKLEPAPSLNLHFLSFQTRVCSLCGQVGVFSPSHRNHYLNVTPNNLLRIYSPDGVGLSSTLLPPLILVRVTTSNPTYQQKNHRNQTCLRSVSRSLTRPLPSGGLCLGCSSSLMRRMRKDGRLAQTRLTPPAEAFRSKRTLRCTPAGN